jgi:hypothetical protein
MYLIENHCQGAFGKKCTKVIPMEDGYCSKCGTEENDWLIKEQDKMYREMEGKNLKEPTTKAMLYNRWTGHLKGKYNLWRKTWNEIVVASNGRCMLNGEQFKNAGNDCHIDHDHVTGEVRGLLCARCNHLLAGIEDPAFKIKAEIYLKTKNYFSNSRLKIRQDYLNLKVGK